MAEKLNIEVYATDVGASRHIFIRSNRGETYWTIEESIELLLQLTPALERALDPTPIPMRYVPSAPTLTKHRHASPQPSIEDLL